MRTVNGHEKQKEELEAVANAFIGLILFFVLSSFVSLSLSLSLSPSSIYVFRSSDPCSSLFLFFHELWTCSSLSSFFFLFFSFHAYWAHASDLQPLNGDHGKNGRDQTHGRPHVLEPGIQLETKGKRMSQLTEGVKVSKDVKDVRIGWKKHNRWSHRGIGEMSLMALSI